MAVSERAPFVVENATGRGPVVLVCDHASSHVPACWRSLGLSARELEAHIAWDPGALATARRLSGLLDAPLVACMVSRLVIDVNRRLDSPTLIPEVSDTMTIPGNRGLADGERQRRVQAIYEPYHAAVDRTIANRVAASPAIAGEARSHEPPPAVVSIHTFTPIFQGVARAMHAGVLFGPDDRLARLLLAELGAEPGMVVGENVPYRPADGVYWTLERHAVARGLASVMIEIRNDLVATRDQADAWARKLERALTRALGQTSVKRG